MFNNKDKDPKGYQGQSFKELISTQEPSFEHLRRTAQFDGEPSVSQTDDKPELKQGNPKLTIHGEESFSHPDDGELSTTQYDENYENSIAILSQGDTDELDEAELKKEEEEQVDTLLQAVITLKTNLNNTRSNISTTSDQSILTSVYCKILVNNSLSIWDSFSDDVKQRLIAQNFNLSAEVDTLNKVLDESSDLLPFHRTFTFYSTLIIKLDAIEDSLKAESLNQQYFRFS